VVTRGRTAIALLIGLQVVASATLQAWGGPGHRLVGLIASKRLTAIARQNVVWLLGEQTLAEVSSWADRQVDANAQTFYWHFLNIPPDATGYDRDRDCPRQPGIAAGARADRWRDCAVDRILYHEERLADATLDRADRAIALKFLVHFVGDLHQPFHALGVGRGGNDVKVGAFGVTDCRYDPGQPPVACNLHMIWDSLLIAHRSLDETHYLALLEKQIADNQWEAAARVSATPAQWAEESFRLAKDALVAPNTNIDERYYQQQIPVVDRRLALAGLRLAAVLNGILLAPPPAN
jgi:nuclease S1